MTRSLFRAAAFLLALAAGGVATAALAGTTGKLAGSVTDEKHQPLAGVTIRIEGQRLGAISNDVGQYFVLGIPGGTYTVRANILGQTPYVAQNVEIRPDFTTTLNIVMRTEAVQMTEVRVEAERPLLQKDATGTTRFISASDIQKLPTRGYRDAAAQQTGVVNFKRNIDNESQNNNTLIVRGGRPNETAYYVDGFSQQDPLTGTSSTSISNNAIQEVEVLTGGFNPEYGRIMSGVVNVVTREGQKNYFGAVEAVSDVLSGNWLGTPRTDYNVYDVSLGGPVIPRHDNLTFYLSSERRWDRDRSPSFMSDAFKQELRTGTLAGQIDPSLAGRSLSDAFKPDNSTSGYTFQGKFAWEPSDKFNIKAGGLGSEDSWREFTETYLFNLQHTPRYLDRNESYFGTANYVQSTKTFYNLGVNWFSTDRKRGDGVAFDNLQPQYVTVGTDGSGHPILDSRDGNLVSPGGYYRQTNPRFDLNLPIFWQPGHVWDDYLQRSSSYYGAQGSMTSQLDVHNQLKVGGDFQRHTLRYFDHFFPVQLGGDSPNLTDWDGYGYDLVPTYQDVLVRDITAGDTTLSGVERVLTNVQLKPNNSGSKDGPKHPRSFSLYGQDKYEREGVIVNGGLRYDYINTDTQALKSESFPLGNPDAIGNLPDSLESQDLQSNKSYSRLSPRIGVAFPVDERTLLRFNYGQFFQQPNLQDLYVSYRFLQYKIRTGGYFVGFGNPNLKPERTTAYEFGAAHQFGTNLRLDATAYYKDVRDLVEITNIPSFPNAFSSYQNRDFATIKGVDVGFTMRPVNHISANVSYSLSYAVGTGSVSNTQRNIAWTASQPPRQTAPLDFDQRHKISLNLDWRLGKGEGPIFSGMHALENTGINLLYNIASGTPYTPTQVYNEVTLAAVAAQPSGPLNSRYGPWTNQLDAKITRGFTMRGLGMEAYVWALNVLDAHNAISVYTSSGSPDVVGFLNTDEGQAFVQSANAAGFDGAGFYNLAQNNPALFSIPRQVRFGLRASF
ncbi:MAG TPA: TonB-dependent receptor [Candidatus Eisenbacteria bacterium]|nr:TonB-dependent receptor [Candidatus Eisenbacteria bacterium]